MKVYTTRASVAAGDDVDAPHAEWFEFPDSADMKTIVAELTLRYLPNVSGGCATWSVASNVIVGVSAAQWSEPKIYMYLEEWLDLRNGSLRLHFNYHGQEDPELIWRIFWGLRLSAQ